MEDAVIVDMRVLVHDISHWQGDLSKYWALFKAKGCKAIIIQSTNGLAYQNYFVYAANEAKDNGFLVGSYHYYRQHIIGLEGGYVRCDPLRQTQNYYNWVTKTGVPMDLPPAIDFENGGNPYGLNTADCEKVLQYTEKMFGRVPMVYSNPSILKSLARSSWSKYPLWIAHYIESSPAVPVPWSTYTLWQFSDKITYTPPGSTAKKPIDHNWFNGSTEDLIAFCGGEGGSMPEPSYEFVRVKLNMTSQYLRFRSRPELYPGTTLVVGRGDVLKLLSPDKVQGNDIAFWHVELDGFEGYVSAGSAYTELI